MSLRGTVRGGKVEFDGAADLPEGTTVEVHAVEGETLLDKLLRHSVADPTLPKDFASELDHYLYGLPKRNGKKSSKSRSAKGKSSKKAPVPQRRRGSKGR